MVQRRKKGSGSITPLENGGYLVRLRQYGRDKSRKANSKAEANRILKSLQDEFQREKESGTLVTSNVKVADYFNQFLKHKQLSISSTSFRRLESTIKTHIIPFYPNVKFNNLTSDMIQQRLIDASESGLSYSSVKKIYEAFTACYKYAISRFDIMPNENPMLAVTMIAQNKFPKKQSEPRYLRNDMYNNERERFINEALRQYQNGSYVYRYGPALVFMLQTGLRESEMSALSYDDIDLEGKHIRVRNSAASLKIDGKYRVVIRNNETKWDSGRFVPLNDMAFKMLTIISQMFDSKELLITTVHGTVLPPLELTKTFNRICKAADITENMDGVGAHCLRHTFATSLFEQGIDPKIISELLGHSSVGVTLNTYVTVSNKMKAKAAHLPQI